MADAKKPTVFDTIRTISSVRPLTYDRIRVDNLPYEPYIVNRAFSLSEDTAQLAALMNEYGHLDHDMQMTFYIHAVRPRRRFDAWPKHLKEEDVTTIAHYYGMSKREAKLHRNLHTKEEIAAMKEVLAEGARPSRYK